MLASSYGTETYQTLKTYMDRQGYKTQSDPVRTTPEQGN